MRQTTLNGYNYRIDITTDRGHIIREYTHIPKEITARIANTLSHLLDQHRRYGILPNPEIDPYLVLPEFIKDGKDRPDYFDALDEEFGIKEGGKAPKKKAPKLKPKPRRKGRNQ
jgi:hypothetical protein|tara:strand:- start:114 stop:455 length:342 start_codon:yes stop_codon:yes gene_type:complete